MFWRRPYLNCGDTSVDSMSENSQIMMFLILFLFAALVGGNPALCSDAANAE